ncbi:hypothetical protein [Ancylobacter pratisalsi]|uniref:hypothetical protein n=1 Tax=Ancylobacter pratisalsi TaxID=1745854 RepID=UPI001AEDA500|nr:hypothetical protein [Ancylobacter pratisalsi]
MRKSFLVTIIALPVVVIGGYLGFKTYVAHVAQSQVEDLFGELKAVGIEATHGPVSYDVFDGRFEIGQVSFAAAGQGTLKVGSFIAFGLDQPSASQIAAKRVELTDVAFDGPLPLSPATEASFRAPSIEIDGFEAPVEVTSPDALPSQIALAFVEAAKAARVHVPQSTTTTWSGAEAARVETQVVHGAATLEQFADGHIARASVEPSHFTISGADTSANGTLGRIDAASIDVAAMLILFDPERRLAEQEFRTVYGSISIDGYEVSTPAGILQGWKRMEITGVAIKPALIAAEDIAAASLKARDYAAAGEALPDEDAADLLRAVATLYDGLRIGAITFTGLTSTQPDGGTGTLASLKAGPLTDGLLEGITLDDFKGTDGDGAPLGFTRLSLARLRPGAVMELAADSLEDPDSRAGLSWFMRLTGLIGAVELTGAQTPSGEKGNPIDIDRLALSFEGEPDTLPTRVAASLRMSGPTSAIKNDKPAFALVPDGMKRASVAVDLAGAWDEDEASVTLAPLYIEVSDAFSLAAKVELSDVDESVFSAQPDEAMAGLLMANLRLLEMTVRDSGIYERKLDEAARQQKLDPDSIRQLFAGFAELLLSQAVSDRPELEPAVQAFIGFIQHPMSTLALRVTPRQETLPIMMVMEALEGDDPLRLVDELDFAVMEPLSPPGGPFTPPPGAQNSAPGAPMPLRP